MFDKPKKPAIAAPVVPVPTLLSKLEDLLAKSEKEIELMQAHSQRLRDGILLLKLRPEFEAIVKSLGRYV